MISDFILISNVSCLQIACCLPFSWLKCLIHREILGFVLPLYQNNRPTTGTEFAVFVFLIFLRVRTVRWLTECQLLRHSTAKLQRHKIQRMKYMKNWQSKKYFGGRRQRLPRRSTDVTSSVASPAVDFGRASSSSSSLVISASFIVIASEEPSVATRLPCSPLDRTPKAQLPKAQLRTCLRMTLDSRYIVQSSEVRTKREGGMGRGGQIRGLLSRQ